MSDDPAPRPPASKALHIALWVVQALLILGFGMSGFGKALQPIEEISKNMPWVPDVPVPLVRFIGTAELAGALGLLLPSVSRVLPWLTPLAAACLATDMLFAALFHAWRGEWPGVVGTVILGSLAAFVAWGRFRKAPIAPRG
jgi:uncharacterized membrane protein YphA (DoxX/SURF4 family)